MRAISARAQSEYKSVLRLRKITYFSKVTFQVLSYLLSNMANQQTNTQPIAAEGLYFVPGADGAADIIMVPVPPVTGTTLAPNHHKRHDYSIAELVTSGLPPVAAMEGSFFSLVLHGEPADQHAAVRR